MMKLKIKSCNNILKEKLQKYHQASSSVKIKKYEYLTGDETLPSNQNQTIDQAKRTYSPLGKAYEKQKRSRTKVSGCFKRFKMGRSSKIK